MPGLTLAETDYIALAQELALRRGPGLGARCSSNRPRATKNPDRQARLRFVMPALSSDAAERGAFFASLRDVANRRHEPWVLDGLRSLHHPLRAESSESVHRSRASRCSPEIQRTGDIFFPKRWMDATLSGHRSPAAAQTVRSFVDAPAGGLSRSAQAHHPLVRRRSVPLGAHEVDERDGERRQRKRAEARPSRQR